MEIRFVDVGAVSMRVATSSPTGRSGEGPAVIFESGGGTPLETWSTILPRVAEFAPVVAYDRAGTGETEWDGEPPTPERVAARLRELLEVLQVPPPYILVGHSWGGALARWYAGLYPGEVAGLLYLDPTDVTQTREEEIRIFESVGAGIGEYEAFYAMMESSLAGAPDAVRAEGEVILSLMTGELARRLLPPPPKVGTTVMLSSRITALPAGLFSFDTDAYARAVFEARREKLRLWADEAGDGQFSVVDTGHFIHNDNPDLVVHAIRELVFGGKARPRQ